MIDSKMKDAFNKQINAELYSAYLYLAMSAYFEDQNLHGFAHWLKVQHDEEHKHAMKFFHYLIERGGRVELLPIEKPPLKWKSPLAAFEAVYHHEVVVTKKIHKLVELSIQENDYAAQVFLNWFVSEQVEEEASAQEIVQKLQMVGDNPGGLYIIDREMAGRN